jgi:hypothetical protein
VINSLNFKAKGKTLKMMTHPHMGAEDDEDQQNLDPLSPLFK